MFYIYSVKVKTIIQVEAAYTVWTLKAHSLPDKTKSRCKFSEIEKEEMHNVKYKHIPFFYFLFSNKEFKWFNPYY